MRWPDIVDMPHGELAEYVDQLHQWTALLGGYELKD